MQTFLIVETVREKNPYAAFDNEKEIGIEIVETDYAKDYVVDYTRERYKGRTTFVFGPMLHTKILKP